MLHILGQLALPALRPDLVGDAHTHHGTLPRLHLEHGGFHRSPWSARPLLRLEVVV